MNVCTYIAGKKIFSLMIFETEGVNAGSSDRERRSLLYLKKKKKEKVVQE